MKYFKNIIDNPSDYGAKGQVWAPEFVDYMKAIVTHPTYADMPDAIKYDGKIQWEAPSNRSGGQYQYTHDKRRDWWRAKAKSIGIDISQDKWISRTAKLIHPTGEKPCKRCGRIMRIAYVYPQSKLIKRIEKYFGGDFEFSAFEPITDILQKIYDVYGDSIFKFLDAILGTKDLKIPDFEGNFQLLLSWIENEYIPREPSVLSPGVMSNAPDRLDGFHSFNKCCRGNADKGRHTENLRSYVTDRRVFEFWSEGDWVAADRLMGLVKSQLRNEKTADNGNGPPTADHIGPLSLGFCHRPEFKLLSRSANSSKNNRMTLWDVEHLISSELKGEQVTSWYAKPLWDMRKSDVADDEKALRISKMLRDNQRNAMRILCDIFEQRRVSFLVYLLELNYADNVVGFENLRAVNFITFYDSIKIEARRTKYSAEQKARRIRIGLEALRAYKEKDNRHALFVAQDVVSNKTKNAFNLLNKSPNEYLKMDIELMDILFPRYGIPSEEKLRKFAVDFPVCKIPFFEDVKTELVVAMTNIALVLSSMWNDDRYVRAEFDIE